MINLAEVRELEKQQIDKQIKEIKKEKLEKLDDHAISVKTQMEKFNDARKEAENNLPRHLAFIDEQVKKAIQNNKFDIRYSINEEYIALHLVILLGQILPLHGYVVSLHKDILKISW